VAFRTLAEAAVFQTPILGERGSSIQKFTYSIGNLMLEFHSGTATPVLVNGKAKGLFLQGEGSFQYLAKDPVVHPLLKFNLKENTRLVPKATEAGLSFGEPVKEALLWFLGAELPALPPPTVPAPKEAFQSAMRYFTTREEGLPSSVPDFLSRLPIGQLAAYQRANDPGKAVVAIELVGVEEHWVYTHDPVRGRLESIFLQKPVDTFAAIPHTPTIGLDYSPLGWKRKAPPDPDFRLAHIDLDLEASNKTFARLKVTETLRVIRPNLQMLSFRMNEGTLRMDSIGVAKLQKYGLQRVLLEGRQDLAFIQRAGFLLVDLGRPARNGETLNLTFEVEGDLLSRDMTLDFWRLTPGEGWFPEPDMAGQSYTVKARIAVEKPFIAIASARTVSRSSSATHNILEASLDKPTLWFSVAAGKYTPVEMIRNGRTVRAWGYSGIGKGAEPLLKTAHGVLDFYAVLFGSVPFDEINLVEVPSLGFGQAPAGLIWFTREAFDAIGDDVNRQVASRGAVGGWVNRLVAHELAHQYWAHQVKMWGYEDQWLTESFAEYTSGLAMRAMKNKGQGTFEIIVKDWGEQARKATLVATIPTANLLSPRPRDKGGDPEHFRYRQELVYYKGAYLLACLHAELGEQAFVQFLREYQRIFAWYPPSITQDVPDLLKAVSGKDFNKWMDDNFWGTGMPEWKPKAAH